MVEFYGIILVDSVEILLRVYKVSDQKWQLLHYDSRDFVDNKLEKAVTPYNIAEVIADFFSNTYSQKVIEWRICAREITREKVAEIARALGQRIEYLDRRRQQELISKGLFTEMW